MLKWITNFTYKIESLSAKAGFIYKLVCGYYRDVIHREADLANITDKDHILCVGGGICPFSAILFHQTTGARVTVIDNNESCIPKAKQVIDRLGLGESVRVFHQDGNNPDILFSDYTVVHLALQVYPMEQVFSAVERKIKPGTKLLVRRPKKQLGGMYCRFSDTLLSCCSFAVHKSRNIGSTALYTKQEGQSAICSICYDEQPTCYDTQPPAVRMIA